MKINKHTAEHFDIFIFKNYKGNVPKSLFAMVPRKTWMDEKGVENVDLELTQFVDLQALPSALRNEVRKFLNLNK